jgi:ABC-type antimicrobial peptide transport system permease subunit
MKDIKNKIKRSGVLWLVGGLLLLVLSVLKMIGDADYIFHGKVTDLNAVIENGEDMPYDGDTISSTYVTYKLYMPLDAYGYEAVFPIIAGKTYNYAVIDESGKIFSVKVKDKKIIKQLESLSGDKDDTMTVTGSLSKTGTNMTHFLKKHYSDFAQDQGLELTQYVIDTTATRSTMKFDCCFVIVIGLFGVAMFIASIRKLRRG